MVQVPMARPALGPHTFAAFEAQVAILDGTGLTGHGDRRSRRRHPGLHPRRGPCRRRHAAHGTRDRPHRRRVVGNRRAAAERAHRRRRLARSLPHVEQARGGGHVPAARPGASDPTPYLDRDALDRFDFGLARMLDGIEALIAGRHGGESSMTPSAPSRRDWPNGDAHRTRQRSHQRRHRGRRSDRTAVCRHADHPAAARVRSDRALRAGRDQPVRRARPGVVLEQLPQR